MTLESENKIPKKNKIPDETKHQKRRNLSGISREQASCNLKILQTLKKGEKLTINENDTLLLVIESNGLMSSFSRYKTGISRYTVTLPICLTIDRISSDEKFNVKDIKNIQNSLIIVFYTQHPS